MTYPTRNVRTAQPTSAPPPKEIVRTQPTLWEFWTKICPDAPTNLATYIRGSCSGVMGLNATVIHVPLSDPHKENDILKLRQHEFLEAKATGRVKIV